MARLRRLATSEWIPLVAITLLAALLRLYALDRLPPGLYHDEAYNGLDAISVINGQYPLFFEANNGREPLFIYLVAASISLFGPSPMAIRLVSALLGIVTVPTAYGMSKVLFGRRVALATAFFTATTFWSLNLSRVGFRAVSLPLFVALVVCGLARGLRSGRPLPFGLAGLALGLSFYTYLAARFLPLALLPLLLYWVWKRQPIPWRGLVALTIAALVVVSPLIVYALQDLNSFLARAGQVSILSPAIHQDDLIGTFTRQIARTLAMFNWRGDFIPRHNLPLRPVFDPLTGVLFIIGVVVSTSRARKQPEYALVLSVFFVMLLPTILAEGAPHFLRAVGVLPVLFVFPAIGLQSTWRSLHGRLSPHAGALLVACFAALSLSFTIRDYFLMHSPSEATYYNFESGATELASEVNRFLGVGWYQSDETRDPPGVMNPDRQVYIVDRLWRDWASLRFLVPDSPGVSVIGQSSPSTTPAKESLLVVWPYDDYSWALSLLPKGRLISVRDGPLERGDLEDQPRLLCRLYEAGTTRNVPNNINEPLEHGIDLLGYALIPGTGNTTLRLFWRATEALDRDYSVFVHVRSGGQMVEQSDSQPAREHYPTHLWRPGDVVADDHQLNVTVSGGGGLSLQVGMYLLETMTRLQILTPDRSTSKGDLITITLP